MSLEPAAFSSHLWLWFSRPRLVMCCCLYWEISFPVPSLLLGQESLFARSSCKRRRFSWLNLEQNFLAFWLWLWLVSWITSRYVQRWYTADTRGVEWRWTAWPMPFDNVQLLRKLDHHEPVVENSWVVFIYGRHLTQRIIELWAYPKI